MALKGTIRDFGVADIFQLISQQAKTGVLVLKNDVDEVRVSFKDGSVVRAESATRLGQMLLGSFLVRAEMLTQEQLDHALKEQRRTLKAVGRVLIDLGYVTQQAVSEFATLQMTETIYSLFAWKNGTYEFEGVPVEPSYEGVEPIRAENIVMNGIRMVDEWPGIREKLPSYAWTVERVKPLPPPGVSSPKGSSGEEFDLSDFADRASRSADVDDIGTYERLIFDLIAPGRDVQKIIDLARLGEFEACRALSSLMSAGYVRVVKPAATKVTESQVAPPSRVKEKVARGMRAAGRIVVSASLVIIAAMLLGRISPSQIGLEGDRELEYSPQPVQGHLSESQLRVIRRALEVYRYETGVYPNTLSSLVEAGMLSERDTHFPFKRPYFYRLREAGFVLLPPVN
jgi:hypothetical protein